ncbi:hypothetical protein N182_18505 [Sinorhizobium sp. GL2]|nr:hypothetical protein N182_18505 [Sinorhizobium sp. GL2]
MAFSASPLLTTSIRGHHLVEAFRLEMKATTLRIDRGRWVVALAQSGSICIFQQHYRAI